MANQIQAGCMFQGTFYPCDPPTTYYGYLQRGVFLDLTSDFDFDTLEAGAQAYYWTSASGYVPIPAECSLGFMCENVLYRSKRQAEKSGKIIHPPGLLIPPARKPVKQCSLCGSSTNTYHSILSKIICYACLKARFINGQLFFDTGEDRICWSALVIYEAYKLLSAESPEDLPSTCPLPCDTIICVGEREEVGPGYPSYGHIVGCGNQCMEEGCREHVLCKKCANNLAECPLCHHEVLFEVVPRHCVKCGAFLCYDFKTPCGNCGIKPTRRKQRRTNQQ